MAKCDYCGSTIIFGGESSHNLVFCNAKCKQKGYTVLVSREISQDVIDNQVKQIHQGLCPKCNGSGPVDVHTAYEVHSLLVFTSWSNIPNICCRSCGIKSQIKNTLISLLFGWWGFPWGFIMTPIQILRNIFAIINPPHALKPSEKLFTIVRANMAEFLLDQQNQRQNNVGPIQ